MHYFGAAPTSFADTVLLLLIVPLIFEYHKFSPYGMDQKRVRKGLAQPQARTQVT